MSPDWSYSGDTGPERWADLSDDFALCRTGRAQSPIDIDPVRATAADLPALDLEYGAARLDLVDTGTSYMATPAGNHGLTVGGDRYRLVQFHFHTPSEHTLDGRSLVLEGHFVHADATGDLAVVGFVAEEGPLHQGYEVLLGALRAGADSVALDDLRVLLPEDLAYFAYEGSLTTPPCSEGVRWMVLETPLTLSAEQIAFFREAHGETNRPLQPLNGREVRYSGG